MPKHPCYPNAISILVKLTDKQRIERDTFDTLVKQKIDGKSLAVSKDRPSFAEYNGDLFFGAMNEITIAHKRILEIGCGSGEICVWLAQQGAAHVLGVDISGESIRIANQRAAYNHCNDRVTFLNCPGECIPKEERSFDMIFINVALHHLEFAAAIDECYRLLEGGGVLVAIEPLVRTPRLQHIRESRLFQRLYPIRRESETEKILTLQDIDVIQRKFGVLQLKPYRLFSPFVYKAKRMFQLFADILYFQEKDAETRRGKCNRLLQEFDEILLRTLPFLASASRYSIILAKKHIVRDTVQ